MSQGLHAGPPAAERSGVGHPGQLSEEWLKLAHRERLLVHKRRLAVHQLATHQDGHPLLCNHLGVWNCTGLDAERRTYFFAGAQVLTLRPLRYHVRRRLVA